MFGRFLTICAAMVLAIGCGKSPSTESTDKDKPDSSSSSTSSSSPTYTLKLRDDKVGDMTVYTETTNNSFMSKTTGPDGKKKMDEKNSVERTEYTEAIFRMDEPNARATKFTRDYKTAEEAPIDGPVKRASYAGKTIQFEKKGGHYTITANGQPLPKQEDERFRKHLESPEKIKDSDLLPKKPVQVNESWDLERGVIAQMADDFPFPINGRKSHGTGKLTQAYTKAGKQWGIVEGKLDLVIDGEKDGLTWSGTVTMSMTLDAVIDGSSNEGIMKMKSDMVLEGKGNGLKMEFTIKADGTETHAPVK